MVEHCFQQNKGERSWCDSVSGGEQRGFTLLELTLTVAIFISLTAFFVINFNTVNSRIALDNEAHEIALWIREAQAYAMGIRAQGTTFTPTYGVFFDAAAPGSFIVFVDRSSPRNYVYDHDAGLACGDPNSECLKQVSLPSRMTVSAVRAGANTASLVPHTPLSVSFSRPNADATIRDTTTSYAEAEITISSPKGYTRSIGIISSGQINVR